MALKRCCGITRAGKPCSIDTASRLTDDNGRFVAETLRCGGRYCIFHAKPFVTRPAQNDRHCIVIFLDLESTGVDIFEDRIVEIAAVHAPQDPRLLGASFSTTVKVDADLLKERGAAAAAVHVRPPSRPTGRGHRGAGRYPLAAVLRLLGGRDRDRAGRRRR